METNNKASIIEGLQMMKGMTLDSSPDSRAYRHIAVSHLTPNKEQARKQFDQSKLNELAASIKAQGLIQPIIVTLAEEEGKFIIVAGERRWRAAQLAGLKEVPVVIKRFSPIAINAISLIENIQREDLNPIEEATAYRKLIEEFKLTHEEVGDQVGKSRAAISNTMRLLNLEQSVQQMLIDGKLTSGHAKPLLTLSADQQIALAQRIVNSGLSAREVEKLASTANIAHQSNSSVIDESISLKTQQYKQRLVSRLSSKVKITVNNKWQGRAIIPFESEEELAWLVDSLEERK